MAPSKARLTIAAGMFGSMALCALWACEEDGGGAGPDLGLDGSPSGYDATVYDAPPINEPDAAPKDASPDADGHVDPLRGIWRGIGDQGGGTTWTILMDLVDGEPKGPPGTVVGVINYPSLGCGGTLVVDDAGAPDSGAVDGGGVSLSLHESVSASCVTDGLDTFTLMPDGGLFFEYRSNPSGPVEATGALSRVDDVGTVGAAVRGVWRSGDLNGNNLRPALVSISRDDKVGAAAGTFAIANADGATACTGHWTLAGKDATSLSLTEVFNDGQINCTGPGSATLQAVAGALTYTRSVDGGAGDASVSLTRF